ncbi:MAG: alpha/beta hydrolase [Herbiconiux sp.]|nr:alpha/beta hydrolase [Herbiconiux sp.]
MSDTQSAVIDVEYGRVGEVSLLLDVYSRSVSAEVDAARAAIVLVHGGGWFRGDKSKEVSLATKLVDAGYLVFAPNYREAPEATFPASRDDVLAAERWALASDWAFDRDKLAFFGGSAGGNLVVEASIATGRPAVSWSGMFDLLGIVERTDDLPATPTTQDLDAMKSADINQTGPNDAFLRWTILNEVGGDRSLLAEASTTRHASPKGGPVYLANSLNEFVPVGDAQAMQSALAAAGIASTLQLIPGTHHAEGYTEAAIGPSLTFLHGVFSTGAA